MFNNRCFNKIGTSICSTGYSDTFYYDDNGDKCPFRGFSAYICKDCCKDNNCKCCCKSSLPCCISLYGSSPYDHCELCSTKCEKVVSVSETDEVLPVPQIQSIESGIFENNVRIGNNQAFPLITTSIMGNAIEHVNGNSYIFLLPNRSYYFNWAMNTLINARLFNVGAKLILDGQSVLGGENTTTTPVESDSRFAFTFAEGIINTGRAIGELSLIFLSNLGPLESSIILEVQLIN